MKLSVNIDHIATVREQRKEGSPSPIFGALLAEKAGANGITAHLREDRRHTNDEDIYLLKKTVKRLNLEMALTKEIKKIALDVIPAQVTLVPEKRQELTTEGGLAVFGNEELYKKSIEEFQKKGIEVSLFIEPEKNEIDAAKKVNADIVEFHTGIYANAYLKGDKKAIKIEIAKLNEMITYANQTGLRAHIGHGLNLDNIVPFIGNNLIEEASIGHSIIADAIYEGIEKAVNKMREKIL